MRGRAFWGKGTAYAEDPGGLGRGRQKTTQRGVRGEPCVGAGAGGPGVGISSGALEVTASTCALTLKQTERKTRMRVLNRLGVYLQL